MPARRIIATYLFVLALTLVITPALAQETTGTIEGRLVDTDGKPVAFANINVTSPSLQGGRGVMSSSGGYFGVFKLPVGIYKVTISHVSYQDVVYEEVDVRLGRTTALGKVTLASKTYEAPAIIVTEKKPLIDPNATTMGANLELEEFKDLPLDRDYRTIPTLLPHANESFLGDGVNFAGATGQETRYFVDGAETTNPFNGVTGTRLPYNFVRDVEVRTGGYEAEYRSSLGGIMNVVSHSGGNAFHGQVFGFFQNNEFSREPRLSFADPPETEFTEYDLGASLGGPIKKDKVWFFAAYNPTFRNEDVEILGLGFHEDKAITHIFAGKLEWKATKRTEVTLATFGDPGTRNAVSTTGPTTPTPPDNPDPFLIDRTSGGVNVSVSATHMFSDMFFLEGSVSRLQRRDKSEGSTERGRNEPTFVDLETGAYSGGYGEPQDIRSVQTTADFKGTFILGRHQLKGGIEYRDNQLDFRENYHYLYRESDTLFTEVIFRTPDGTVHNRIPSAFVQDSWRITDRIRVNAGLRWDGQFLVASDGSVAQKITNQYQPRIGFVYQPGKVGSQKVFGSFGRFYQELGMVLSNFNHNEFATYGFYYYDHDPRIDPSGRQVTDEGGGVIAPEVEDLEGQHFDEFTLGYERQVGQRFVVGTRGVYRVLRQGIEDGFSEETGEWNYGNPGKGDLSGYPEIEREYIALELTAQITGGATYNARASYVLSRNRGNYTGLYESEIYGNPLSNYSAAFDIPEMSINDYGRLPNDRTHVFKLSGTYRVGRGLTTGTSFTWQSGTPLSVIEGASWGYPWLNFAQERGSAGRTPSIWDLNLRFVYDLSYAVKTEFRPRLIFDIFHLGSQRKPVDFDEIRNFDQDDAGNQINPNPTYGLATRFQPPTAARLGIEISF